MSDIHLLINTAIPEIWQTRCQPHQIQHIAIEQQPQGKYANTKMIILSHLLVRYFQEHIATGPHLVTCRLVSAGKKYNKQFLARCQCTRERKYKNRKLLSIRLCRSLCQEFCPTVMNRLKCKKADDLADSFLMAFSEHLEWEKPYGLNGKPDALTAD
jgi:hypothetical protein